MSVLWFLALSHTRRTEISFTLWQGEVLLCSSSKTLLNRDGDASACKCIHMACTSGQKD